MGIRDWAKSVRPGSDWLQLVSEDWVLLVDTKELPL